MAMAVFGIALKTGSFLFTTSYISLIKMPVTTEIRTCFEGERSLAIADKTSFTWKGFIAKIIISDARTALLLSLIVFTPLSFKAVSVARFLFVTIRSEALLKPL